MLPFERYREKGRKLLGRPAAGDSTSRRGHGPAVFDECGMACAYCGRKLDSPYEAWLAASTDYVIPHSLLWHARYSEWMEDLANLVACCTACEEFLADYRVEVPPPNGLEDFFDMRDKVFLEKQQHILARHEQERDWYRRWVVPRLTMTDSD
ncbi:MAG: hypothetical protein QF662_04055 [Phycisphaerae bacterium]|nr:hypothetical protein [Phycisphaerae bacterium]